jgi:hypothetical protein
MGIQSALSPTFRKFNPETIGRQGEHCLLDAEICRNDFNAIAALGETPQFLLGAEILGGRPIRPLASFQQI